MIRSLLMGLKKKIEVRSQESEVRRLFSIFCFLTSVFCLLSSTPAFAAAITGKVEVVGQCIIKPRKGLEERIKAERSCVISKDLGLKYAVVFIKGINGSLPLLKETITIDQRNKAVIPHVLAVPVGTTTIFKNSDPFVHRIISNSDTKKLRMEFAYEGATMDVTFDKPGTVELWCDDHKRMQAWILVLDTPFFAVTDERGNFTIPNVPSGRYTVEVWHEVLGTQTQEVEVKQGEDIKVDFKLHGKEF